MVLVKVITTVVFLFSSFKVLACELLKSSEGSIKLIQAAKEIDKVAHINSAKSNPAEYCEINMALRYINVNSESAEITRFQCMEMGKDELIGYLDKTFRVAEDLSPWTTSLVQTPSAQNFSLIRTAKIEADLDQASQVSVFKQSLEKIKLVHKKSPQRVFKKNDSLAFNELSKDKMPSYITKSVACANLSLKNTFGCSSALSEAIKIAAPVKIQIDSKRATLLTPVKAWKTMLNQEMKYAEGLRIASLKMVENLQDKDTRSKNILSDLIESFKQVGMSQSESEDATLFLAKWGFWLL